MFKKIINSIRKSRIEDQIAKMYRALEFGSNACEIGMIDEKEWSEESMVYVNRIIKLENELCSIGF